MKLSTYVESNICVKCNRAGEVIYHQYVNAFSCQYCGEWWNNG